MPRNGAAVEAALARAEALSEQGEHAAAADAFADGREAVAATGAADLELRSLLGESLSLAQSGGVPEALSLLARARDLAEGSSFSDVDRAAVLLRLGICRYHLSSISTAVSLLSSALELADRSGLPCDELRGDILDWRSRCHRRQRDWQAAREDVERALELAESAARPSGVGPGVLPGVAGRRARGPLAARADLRGAGARLLRGARGPGERRPAPEQPRRPELQLGNPERAVELLSSAYQIALEAGDEPEAGLAHLFDWHKFTWMSPRPNSAEDEATRALELFGERPDYLQGIGTAQLVLGRALLAQDRLIEAEEILVGCR